MAPKRLFPPEEPSTASSPSNEQDNEPSPSTIPPFPSLSSDSDSEHRWIIKPNKPLPNAKRAKKNKFIAAAKEEQANITMNTLTSNCEVRSLRENEVSEDVSKSWNHLQVVELEFAIYIKCVQLIAAQAKLIFEAYNSSKNH